MASPNGAATINLPQKERKSRRLVPLRLRWAAMVLSIARRCAARESEAATQRTVRCDPVTRRRVRYCTASWLRRRDDVSRRNAMPIPTLWSLLALSVVAIAIYVFFGEFLRNWFRFRGVRLIVCPENFQPAAVKVDARRAAKIAALSGEPELRLDACSRWPEKEGCDQACLTQIESAPEKSALENIVDGWFLGKRCYFC